jgi:hypothetical protein
MEFDANAPKNPPHRSDVLAFLSLLSGGLFLWLLWAYYEIPELIVALIGLNILLASWKCSVSLLLVMVLAFIAAEWQTGSQVHRTSSLSLILLVVHIVCHLRMCASMEWKPTPKISLTFWQRLKKNIGQLFPQKQIKIPDSSPFHWFELVEIVGMITLSAYVARLWWQQSPTSAMEALNLPVHGVIERLLSLIIPAFVLVFVARSFWLILGRERRGPLEAELQLNDETWMELKPDLDRMGRRLGTDAARHPPSLDRP